MRPLALPLVLVLACACAGNGEPLGTPCAVSSDCDKGQLCVNGGCVVDPGPLPIGEGEGQQGGEGEGQQGGEGEGQQGGEGEGQQGGEGEGQQGGEGEGQQGGEGEGQVGEGEGEGGGQPPVCSPGCGAFMTCTATNVCTNDAGDSICSTFGVTGVDFFADLGPVNLSSGARFNFDGQDRFYVDRLTQMLPGMTVDFTVSSGANDAVVYVIDDFSGVCPAVTDAVNVTKVDSQFGNPETFRAKFGNDDIDIVVTSFASINGGAADFPITIKTRGILCDGSDAAHQGNALNDVTDTQTTYDQCFRALTTTSNTCADNPCARDVNGNVTGKFCAMKAAQHTTGTPITLQTDTNVCCNSSVHTPPCP